MQDDELTGCLGALIIPGLIAAYFLLPDWLINTWWYSVKYDVTGDQVQTSEKPTDCDWSRSPLGNKGCHYKLSVAAYNANGALIGGDYAPKYGRDDRTKQTTVSYDNGKTWKWFYGEMPSQKVKRVVVDWVKVDD
jgi:hypothetical protein